MMRSVMREWTFYIHKLIILTETQRGLMVADRKDYTDQQNNRFFNLSKSFKLILDRNLLQKNNSALRFFFVYTVLP